LNEPITVEVVIGLFAVFAGLWIATTGREHPAGRANAGQ
jgi:hypothetical protein